MRKGIDVSKHNGTLDWEKIKADGIEFAVIRIGHGNDVELQDDSQANFNMDECERLGIPYDVYIYSYALNESDAESEVKHMLRMIKGRKPHNIWYDMEDADGYKAKNNIPLNAANAELYTRICATFTTEIQLAGYKNVGIYASKSVLEDIIGKEYLEHGDIKVWVAQWNKECTYQGRYDMWQYTSDGIVNGSSARTDMNYYYGSFDDTESGDDTVKDLTSQSVSTKYSIGQHVVFSTCYKSSTDGVASAISAKNMSKNHGLITKIIPGRNNPYLIDDGLCWCNDSDIREVVTETTQAATTKYKIGQKVRVSSYYASSTEKDTSKAVIKNATGTITKVIAGARNPYLLDNGAIGWCNDGDIREVL